MSARGIGLHALVVSENAALRVTQAEVERHPAWLGYAEAPRPTSRCAVCLLSQSSARIF
jgi:hypothetical protein